MNFEIICNIQKLFQSLSITGLQVDMRQLFVFYWLYEAQESSDERYY